MKTQSILQTALLAVGFSAFTLIGSAQAQIINVETIANSAVDSDLNGTAYSASVAPLSYAGTTWNVAEFAGGTTTGSSLLTSTGVSTGVGYSMSVGFNSFTGISSSNPLFQSGGYIGDPTFFSIPAATLTISGLNSALTYNLAIVSDANNTSGGTFTISGYGTQTTTPTQFSPFVLDNQYVEFVSVTPDISGDITISMAAPNGNPFIPINGFQLQEVPAVPEPSTYALMGLGALALLVVSRRRKA